MQPRTRKCTFVASLVLATVTVQAFSQEMPRADNQNRHDAKGLHATIGAARGYHGDLRLLLLSFRLINESDRTLNSQTESWKLVIDGREAPDPGGQLWMGGKPSGGYDIVNPGQTFIFGKALPYSEYFPQAREYRVLWRSTAFTSNEIVVRGHDEVQPD